MKSIAFRRLSCSFVAAAMLSTLGMRAFSQPPEPVVESILNAWQERTKRLPRATYRVQGEMTTYLETVVDGETGRPIQIPAGKAKQLTWPVEWTLTFDLPTNRFRLETCERYLYVPKLEVRHYNYIRSFDGENFYESQFRDRNPFTDFTRPRPELVMIRGYHRDQPIDALYRAPFVGHGVVPVNNEAIYPGRLVFSHDPEFFVVHAHSTWQNRPCTILRTRPVGLQKASFDEIWVDRERDGAVIRLLDYFEGRVSLETSITYNRTDSYWLPESWVRTWRNGENTMMVEQSRVLDRTIEPPLSDRLFLVEPKPGMLVLKGETKQSADMQKGSEPGSPPRFFRVESGGTLTEIWFDKGGIERTSIRNYVRHGLVIGALLLVIGASLFLIFRRKRHHVKRA